MTLYSLICEGYTKDFRQLFGPSDRKMGLDSGLIVVKNEIPSYFREEDLKDLRRFRNWQLLGFPRANREDNDMRLLEIIRTVKPYADFYAQRR